MNPRNVLGIEITLNVVTFILPLARFWILRKKKRTNTEVISDAIFLLAVAMSMGNVSGVCYKLKQEIDLRKQYPPELVEFMMLAPKYLKMTYLFGIAYMTVLYLLKGAFIAFYWGLFSGMESRRRLMLPIAAAFVFITFITTLLMYIFWARPIEVNWSPNLLEVLDKAALASFFLNTWVSWVCIGTDLIVMGIPLLVISTLRLRRPEKLALVFVFTMGGMSIAASVTRYIILYRYIRHPPITNETLHILEMWGTVEIATAMFAYCLPSFRVLYVRLLNLPNPHRYTPSNSVENSSGRGRYGRNRRYHRGDTIDTTNWTVGGGETELGACGTAKHGGIGGGDGDHGGGGGDVVGNGHAASYSRTGGDAFGAGDQKIYVDRTFDVVRETWHDGPNSTTTSTRLKHPQTTYAAQSNTGDNSNIHLDTFRRNFHQQGGKTLIHPLPNSAADFLPPQHPFTETTIKGPTKGPTAMSSQEKLRDGYVDYQYDGDANMHSDNGNESGKTSLEEKGRLQRSRSKESEESGEVKNDFD